MEVDSDVPCYRVCGYSRNGAICSISDLGAYGLKAGHWISKRKCNEKNSEDDLYHGTIAL